MRVLFCTTGGLGHVLPLRPLARALQGRGHAVAWVTAPDALHTLDGLGFDLFEAGPNFETSRRQFRAEHGEGAGLTGEALSTFTFPRLFGAVLGPAMVDGVERAILGWRPDLVVHEPAALAAPLVCRSRGVRHLTHNYGLRLPKPQFEAAMCFFAGEWRDRGFDMLAAEGQYRQRYLEIAPRSLQPSIQPADHGVFRFNPYSAHEPSDGALPEELGTALRAATTVPRIYITFGTVFNRSAAIVAAVRAAAALGATVVVTVGVDGDAESFTHLGRHVHVHRFLDQATLLQHVDLVVSHGGSGTMLGAASHGVPQVVLPQAADHFRNARALSLAGAGRSLEPGQQTVTEISEAMTATLRNSAQAVAAASLADEMSAMPDATGAAEWLERW